MRGDRRGWNRNFGCVLGRRRVFASVSRDQVNYYSWWLWGKERERLEESLLSKIEQEKEEEGEEGEGDLWWIERNDDRGQDSRILGERQRGTHRFDE